MKTVNEIHLILRPSVINTKWSLQTGSSMGTLNKIKVLNVQSKSQIEHNFYFKGFIKFFNISSNTIFTLFAAAGGEFKFERDIFI